MAKKLGDCLPQFKTCAELFTESKGVRDILYLFYMDILDFYAVMMGFFRTKGQSRIELFV